MLQSHHHLKRRGESEEKLHSENLRVPNGPMLTLSPQSKPNIVVIKPSSTYYLPQVESARSTSSPLCLRYPPTPYYFFLSSSYPPSPSRVCLVSSTPNTKVTIRRLQQRWAQYYQSRQSQSVLIPAHSGMAQTAFSLRRRMRWGTSKDIPYLNACTFSLFSGLRIAMKRNIVRYAAPEAYNDAHTCWYHKVWSPYFCSLLRSILIYHTDIRQTSTLVQSYILPRPSALLRSPFLQLFIYLLCVKPTHAVP